MRTAEFELICELAMSPSNGWSIGTFGAIAEFMREQDEPVEISRNASSIELITQRGAMRIAPAVELKGVAWDNLSARGRGWSHELAFCVERPAVSVEAITPMGPDKAAIRAADRGASLYNLGTCQGAVTLAIRSRDAKLNRALEAAAGRSLFDHPEVVCELMRAQPHRIGMSAAGRIEVFQPIPDEEGSSPAGPHTHVLPKLIAARLTHASTAPVPSGWQPALTMHPPSPWRDRLGTPCPFNAEVDRQFASLLERFGTNEDKAIEAEIRDLLMKSGNATGWPKSRRARLKARITLRRFAATGNQQAEVLQSLYDFSAGKS